MCIEQPSADTDKIGFWLTTDKCFIFFFISRTIDENCNREWSFYLYMHLISIKLLLKSNFLVYKFFFIIKAAIVGETIFIEYLQRDKHAYLTHIYIAVKYTNWLTKFIDNQS